MTTAYHLEDVQRMSKISHITKVLQNISYPEQKDVMERFLKQLEDDNDQILQFYVQLMDELAGSTHIWPKTSFITDKNTGNVTIVNLSLE